MSERKTCHQSLRIFNLKTKFQEVLKNGNELNKTAATRCWGRLYVYSNNKTRRNESKFFSTLPSLFSLSSRYLASLHRWIHIHTYKRLARKRERTGELTLSSLSSNVKHPQYHPPFFKGGDAGKEPHLGQTHIRK